MTYCLNMRPPVVSVDDRLIGFVKEAFAISKVEDNPASSGARAQQQCASFIFFTKVASSEMTPLLVSDRVNQKIAIIQLLAAVMSINDFALPVYAFLYSLWVNRN